MNPICATCEHFNDGGCTMIDCYRHPTHDIFKCSHKNHVIAFDNLGKQMIICGHCRKFIKDMEL